MLDLERISKVNTILILNKPHILTKNNFYIQLFKVPEVLSRLRQYREILFKNNINIPVWVYCLTQNITTLRGTPQPHVVNFLVRVGLYDRYISKVGWPNRILGSSHLTSVLSDERLFEKEVLDLTVNQKTYQPMLSLVEVKSYYDTKLKQFCLTNLTLRKKTRSFKKLLEPLKQDLEKEKKKIELVYRFLCPHEDGLSDYMKSIEIFPRDFLEYDESLKWLWPLWKKTQLYSYQTEQSAHL